MIIVIKKVDFNRSQPFLHIKYAYSSTLTGFAGFVTSHFTPSLLT